MKKAVVSGATGFVGVHLVNELIKNGIDVYALCRDNSDNLNRLPNDVNVVNCSMDDYDSLTDVFNNDKPDVFYHIAWEGATGSGRSDPNLQIKNAMRTVNAIKIANDIGCNKFIATGTVYENLYEQMISSTIFKNASFYLMNKRFTYDMIRQYALKLGILLVWCTFCHPVGKYMKHEQLIAYTVKALLNGESPSFGPAQDWFDIIAVEDLATGLYHAGKMPLSDTKYYIGSGGARLLKDYLIQIPEILNFDTPVLIGAKSDDGIRFKPEWFDCTKFTDETNFKPRVSYEDAICNVRDYLIKNRGVI